MMSFFSRPIHKIKHGWNKPITRRDRAYSCFVGAWGGFIYGLLFSLAILSDETGRLIVLILRDGLVSATIFASLALVFPRIIFVICLPVSIWGIST